MTTRPITIVGIAGSVTRPSRTTSLVSEILEKLAARVDAEVSMIELADSAPDFFAALTPDKLVGRGRALLTAIETADLLVIGTPVYRASLSGALKHVFDLVDHRAFVGKPVALAATGGSLMHGLVTEHQLRPLFGFLNALTLPTTVYAVESDFQNYALTNTRISERIARLVEEAALQLNHVGEKQRVSSAAA
jgi:FMN reductase